MLTNLRKAVDKVTLETAQEILSETVHNTPFDSGKAKANWQLGTRDNNDVFETGKLSASRAEQLAIQRASGVEKNAKEYLIFNNLPYIYRLENGSSKQAPTGMLRNAILKVARKT